MASSRFAPTIAGTCVSSSPRTKTKNAATAVTIRTAAISAANATVRRGEPGSAPRSAPFT